MKKANKIFNKKSIYIILTLSLMVSCEDFLEVQEPLDQIESTKIFDDEITANAAVTTLYGKLRDEVLLTGKSEGLGVILGVYSDEMDYFGFGGEPLDYIYQHNVFPNDLTVENLWNNSYSLIYMANAVLEGVNESDVLNVETKNQLRGEALFIRTLTYFYLVNLFGDIPYPRSTNYETNSTIAKTLVSDVYINILADLNEAKTLLGNDYISGERVRANNMVVSALLARVYLYLEQWDLAESEASILINNPSMFSLESEVENEFLKESTSAILQFKPKMDGQNTLEASTFIFTSGPPPLVSLNPDLIETMELDDLRKEYWIGEISDASQTWYFPNKYKYRINTGTSLEYSIVFRLSEQYLIRAESRARLGDFIGALQDLNMVRNRAGLVNSEATNENEIIDAIIMERYHELFSEYGHRWFDIKRLGLANEILAPIKTGWMTTHVILPIPETELMMNPNLNPQNPGY